MRKLMLLLPFAVATIALAEIPAVAPTDAARRVADGHAVLVDIREPAEWAQSGVAAPATLLPKSDFDGDQAQWKRFLDQLGDKEVILYCRSGRRAEAVGARLAEKGVRVANAGGLKDWTAAGLPTRPADAPKP